MRNTEQPSDRELLAFESRHYRHAGAKMTAVRDELQLTQVAYWQRLNTIIEAAPTDLAVEFGPLIARLRRMRDARMVLKRAG